MPSPNGVVRSFVSIRASLPRGPVSAPAARVHLGRGRTLLTVNVVVLAGTVAADPVTRRMPSGDEVTELRISVPETGRRLLPLPVAAWHATVGRAAVDATAKGDSVLVHGQLVRRFYRSGAGARSLTEVVATGLRRLEEGDRKENEVSAQA